MSDAQPWIVAQACMLTQSGLDPRHGWIVGMTDLEAFPREAYLAPGDPNMGQYSSYQVTVEFYVKNDEPNDEPNPLEDRVSRLEWILGI